uniref:Uncharacterized protein n=1 Tax=Oryza sativa subsp. indica TaxID=39946 RepID=A0A679B9H3_ORYSI|nr:hypothetical protein [Oryza sativa Indica Group]BBD82429.1 hypothetical protein [Oryza sativa Indica Group]
MGRVCCIARRHFHETQQPRQAHAMLRGIERKTHPRTRPLIHGYFYVENIYIDDAYEQSRKQKAELGMLDRARPHMAVRPASQRTWRYGGQGFAVSDEESDGGGRPATARAWRAAALGRSWAATAGCNVRPILYGPSRGFAVE